MSQASFRLRDARKYLNYFVETKGLTSDTRPGATSEPARRAARRIRGQASGPALMIHGIMPRSGTVYVGELLRRHPDLYAYPHELWEFPALEMTDHIRRFQTEFLLRYKPNHGKLAPDDFLPLVGASLLAYLQEGAPLAKRLLVKMPNVQYLGHFFTMFPHEQLLILVRDGRDLVHSTLRTWPRLNFIQVTLRWQRSARMVLDAVAQLQRDGVPLWLARYEVALQDPTAFVREACSHFDLDPARYPYDEIETIRVIGSSKLAEQGAVTWERHVDRPRNFCPRGYWRQWPTHRKALFKLIAGRSLVQLGYCEDLAW